MRARPPLEEDTTRIETIPNGGGYIALYALCEPPPRDARPTIAILDNGELSRDSTYFRQAYELVKKSIDRNVVKKVTWMFDGPYSHLPPKSLAQWYLPPPA